MYPIWIDEPSYKGLSVLEIARNRFKRFGFELLASEYDLCKTPMLCRCLTCGYEGTKSLHSISRSGCKQCSRKLKIKESLTDTFKKILCLASECNITIKDESYQENQSIHFQCNKCNKFGWVRYYLLKMKKKYNVGICNYCYWHSMPNNKYLRLSKLDLITIYCKFQELGLELLEDDDLIYYRQPLSYQCKQCKLIGTAKLQNILQGKGCKACDEKMHIEENILWEQAIARIDFLDRFEKRIKNV